MNTEPSKKTPCKYGTKCYQQSPQHFAKYSHPAKKRPLEEEDSAETDENLSVPAKKQLRQSPANPDENRKEVPQPLSEDSSSDSDSSSEEEEEVELPPSPTDVKENIRQKFLLDMPDDFYTFWEFCKSLNKKCPEETLNDAGLCLVGPFDVLSNKLNSVKNRLQSTYLQRWRYYYDPPEFQTILRGDDSTGHHFGYFRDCPSEAPVFVGSSTESKGCHITPYGENLFSAVNQHIVNQLKVSDPFTKTKLQKLQSSLQSFAKKEGYSLDLRTAAMKSRDKKVVTKSFHGAGIVVPYDKKREVGYRELPENDSSLKRMLKKVVESKTEAERNKNFENVEEIITNVQFANDEGDPGMGLELGIDMLCYGGDVLHSSIRHLLQVAYTLLGRQTNFKILDAHLKNRRKGSPATNE